jgi:hypothetical protein
MSNRKSLKSLTVAAAITGLIVIATVGRAEAQVGTGGTLGIGTGTGGSGGTAFAAGDFFTSIQQQSDPPVSLTTFELSRFFNKANCDCSTPVNVFIALLSSGIAKRQTAAITTGTVSIVLGNGCNSVQGLNNGQAVGSCLQIASEPVLTFLNQASYTVGTDARTLSTFFNATGVVVDGGTGTTGTATACTAPTAQSFTQTLNFNFDFGSGSIDLSVPFSVLIDLVPPPPPMGLKVQGGDEALVLNWQSIDQALVPDLLGYQILCSRADQYQVFDENPADDGGTSTGAFGSAFQTCPKTRVAAGIDGGVESLNPQFVCSGLLSAQATSDRVEILQNEITYAAAVVAIDNSGNPSAPTIGFGKPVKTLSFYDVYRDETPQGGATGGFCAISTARPGAKTTAALSLLAVASIGVVLTRRRRRPR